MYMRDVMENDEWKSHVKEYYESSKMLVIVNVGYCVNLNQNYGVIFDLIKKKKEKII